MDLLIVTASMIFTLQPFAAIGSLNGWQLQSRSSLLPADSCSNVDFDLISFVSSLSAEKKLPPCNIPLEAPAEGI